jgi:DNA-binding LytR/AlgR family response regulator
MNYKILTIEDDLLVAEDLKNKLSSLGYSVVGNASSLKEATELVYTHSPDIVIADIQIDGAKDGIDTIHEIYKSYKCPVIYLTANSDATTVKRAMATSPAAFLLKPYKISEFSINIDLAIKNFREKMTFEKVNAKVSDSIFLPQEFLYYRVRKKDIYYVEADGAYVKVICKEKKYQITVNLKSFERQLNDFGFIRVSRKYLVNSEYIGRINGNALYLALPGPKEQMIAISKDLRQDILDRFVILKTKDRTT